MLSSVIRYVAPYDSSSSSSNSNKVSVEADKADAVIVSADGSTRDCVVCRRKVTHHFLLYTIKSSNRIWFVADP
jgi:hypothetical protein